MRDTVAASTVPALFHPALLHILRCPLCKGKLKLGEGEFQCGTCSRTYPIVLGIPDLRVYEDPLIPLADDYAKGRKIAAQAERLGFADLVRYYWSLPTYPPTPPDLRERFIRHVLTDEVRIQAYKARLGSGDAFLDVGCGTAALVKVAQEQFPLCIGCDVAFRWLLIARKRLQEANLPANLVCCCADYLPFADGVFSSVASVSLLEHVSQAATVVHEFCRVLEPDGRVFIWTTNRFSLVPEPHVRVWGVGFLPRRWMAAYVRWRRGMQYEKKHLLSWRDIRNLFRKEKLTRIEFSLPAITPADWENLKGLERVAARLFRVVAKLPVLRRALVIICPALQVTARRKKQMSSGASSPAIRSGVAT